MITSVNPTDGAKWSVILPIKGGSQAKSRLESHHPDSPALAKGFAERTLAALLACREVGLVMIVTDDQHWARLVGGRIMLVADPGAGLNPAICAARDQSPRDSFLAAIPSDLPLLNAIDLAEALAAARAHPRAFVRDKDGSGTTLLTALKSADLNPLYGASSATAHLGSGAVELSASHSVRFDVDTLADLERIKTRK